MRTQSQKQTIVLFVVVFFLFLLTSTLSKAQQALSDDDLESKPVLQSFDDALKTPTDAYRLFLCNLPYTSPAAEIEKLINLHQLYLDPKQVKSFAPHLPKLKVLKIVYVDAGEASEAEKAEIKQLLATVKMSFDF